MANSTLQTVHQFQKLLGSGSDDWTNLVANDISFTGPVDHVSGLNDFIELNKSFFPLVRGYTPVSTIEQGKQVLLEGVFTLATPGGGEMECPMAEVYEIANGKIQNIRVYYDAEPFRKEFTQ